MSKFLTNALHPVVKIDVCVVVRRVVTQRIVTFNPSLISLIRDLTFVFRLLFVARIEWITMASFFLEFYDAVVDQYYSANHRFGCHRSRPILSTRLGTVGVVEVAQQVVTFQFPVNSLVRDLTSEFRLRFCCWL